MDSLVCALSLLGQVLVAEVNYPERAGTIGVNQVLGDVSGQVSSQGEVVFILGHQMFVRRCQAEDGFSFGVGADQLELLGLALKVLVLQARVVLQNEVDRLLAHLAERSPLSSHQRDQARVRHLYLVKPRKLGGLR